MIKKLFNLSPLLYVFLVWFVFASPFFLQGLVPYSSKYQLNFFAPWSHYEKFQGPVKNNAMPDVHTQIYPWKKLTIDTYKMGQIPLWNPYSFSGNPQLANFQTAVFSPFNLLFFLFSFIDAWSILVLLQPLLAGYFMYLLLRQYGLSKLATLLGSTSFMFCGFMVVWMAYATLGFAILYLPLSLYAIEKFIEKQKKKTLVFLVLSITLSIFSGHFQTSLYALGFIFIYIVWKAKQNKEKNLSIALFGAYGLGLVLALPQILPTIQLYEFSVRAGNYIAGGGIPWKYLITIVAPDFFGNPVTRNDWFGFYAEWASFVGIVPILFASLAVLQRKSRHVLFFSVVTLGLLVLIVDSPVQSLIGALHIPVLSTSNPSRIIVLLSFVISVLSGFGLDFWLKKDYVEKNIWYAIGFWLGIVLLVWILLVLGKPFSADKLTIATRNFVLPTALLFFSIFVLLVSRYFNHQRFLVFGALLFLAIASFDSLRFAQKWMPFDPKSLVYPSVPVIDAIKKNIGYGRMFGNFGGETAVFYEIPSIEGYDPLYIQRYGEFIRSSNSGDFIQAERSVVSIGRNGLYINRVLDLLGVSVIFHPRADTNQNWAYPVWNDITRFDLIYEDNKFQLFRNKLALQRAHMYFDYDVLPKEKILSAFYAKDFNIKNKVLLEKNPKLSKVTGTPREWSTQILMYSPNYIKIKVNTEASGLLFLADNNYPGWKALVNGSKSEVFTADYTFRAVVVPKGSSLVEFSYWPER